MLEQRVQHLAFFSALFDFLDGVFPQQSFVGHVQAEHRNRQPRFEDHVSGMRIVIKVKLCHSIGIAA